jgi:hypothetical protein
MIIDIEPIAYIFAFAIDRQLLTSYASLNQGRNKFLFVLTRSIVIAAMREGD